MFIATEVAYWFILVLLVSILAIAAVSDIRRRRIPNWTVLGIGALFAPWIFVGLKFTILSALGAAGLAFLVSFPLYFVGVLGAGDSKFLTATGLFIGLDRLPEFLLLVVLAGGAIAIVSLILRPTRALVMLQLRGKGDFGRGIPYGVAIALAAVYVIAGPPFQHTFS